MVMTDEKKSELLECFKAILKSEEAIEVLNEDIKTYRSSIKDTFDIISKIMEVDEKDKEGKKAIIAGYKEYVQSIIKPEITEIQSEMFAVLKALGLLEKLKKEE